MKVESINVAGDGFQADLPLFRFRSGLGSRGPQDRSVFILAGQHGWEYTGIVAAFELLRHLHEQEFADEVAVLPISNPFGTRAATRVNPLDGANLNSSYDLPWRDEHCVGPSEALRRGIWEAASMYSRVIDLHSAGLARYLNHVIVARESDIEDARRFGLPFVIVRTKGKEHSASTLTGAVSRSGRAAFAVELGSGTVVRKEDVDAGVSAILRFLRHVGAVLGYDEPIRPTPEDLVFRHDARLILKAQREGVVWHHKVLGEMAEEGDTILTILDSHDWQPVGVASPARGRIIYQRDHGLVKAEDTVAMLLPVQA